MRVLAWSDYLCPWCYLGLDLLDLLEGDLDVAVTTLPYQLRTDLPPGGVPVRQGGRLAATLERIEALCTERGMPFRPPTRLGDSRAALDLSEVVRARTPEAYPALHRRLFEAAFVEGRDLDDDDTLAALLAELGIDAGLVRAPEHRRVGAEAVDLARAEARNRGVTATPSWLIGSSLLVPGVPDRATMARWVTRVRDRAGAG